MLHQRTTRNSQGSIFFLKDNDSTLELDTSHAYYYQVQFQLGISEVEKCYFVVWSSESMHVEKIAANMSFFQENLVQANKLIEKDVLLEIIGCWYTKLRKDTTVDGEIVHPFVSDVEATVNDDEAMYCYCKGKDDGSKMICYENDDCSSG